MSKHLWEIDHPYYMNEGNYFQNGCHTTYPTFADFLCEWKNSDIDYNWFVRWDWLEGEDNGAGEYAGDDYYRNGIFKIQRIGQRKALLDSHEVAVCRADESAVMEFLKPYWEYMQSMWEPLSNPPPAASLGGSE